MSEPNEESLSGFVTVMDGDTPAVKIGLMATLYFGPAHAKRHIVLDLLRDYARMTAGALKWQTVPPRYVWAGMTDDAVADIASRVAATASDEAWQFTAHGGATSGEASDYVVRALGARDWQESMGQIAWFSAAFPIDFFAPRRDTFVGTIVRWAKALKPLHGYAGLGILPAWGSALAVKHEPTVFSIAQHFPGLEVDAPTSHGLNCGNAIKGVNWLTILSDSMIERVGGLSTLQQQLPPPFFVHTYDGGAVVQAGPRPQMGDRNRDRWPELYIQLNKLLKPVRAVNSPPMHRNFGPNRFDAEATNAWLARFDR